MDKYSIIGGGKLKGEIKVAGAKNQALKVLAACALTNGEITMNNAPRIEDVLRMNEILESIGAKISWQDSTLKVNCKQLNNKEPDSNLVRKLRASIMFAGPLLARHGLVSLPHPGGCVIGKRPIDMFLNGLEALGAKITIQKNDYKLTTKGLVGTKIVMPWVMVTATESLMMTACLAKGKTTIVNAAMEPEITALAEFLNSCGAKIEGAGTPEIVIEGVECINGGTCDIIPDRIEAGSFIIMGLITGSRIKVKNCNPKHLETFISTLYKAGADLEIGKDYVATRPSELKGTEIRTHEYPGFPTDLQAPFTVLMTQAQGLSLVHETIYEGRLFYTDKLTQMGAQIIMCDPHRIIVYGPTELYGSKLESPDLRAGISLVLAGLVAKGETTIENIYQIERGYENIVPRLQALGAKIEKLSQ